MTSISELESRGAFIYLPGGGPADSQIFWQVSGFRRLGGNTR